MNNHHVSVMAVDDTIWLVCSDRDCGMLSSLGAQPSVTEVVAAEKAHQTAILAGRGLVVEVMGGGRLLIPHGLLPVIELNEEPTTTNRVQLSGGTQAVMETRTDGADCPDCGVKVGEVHSTECQVARCRICGEERLICPRHRDEPPTRWHGEWPGEDVCTGFGWWVRWEPTPDSTMTGRWVNTTQDDRRAVPDVNRVMMATAEGKLRWDQEMERWVINPQPKQAGRRPRKATT